MKAQVMGIGHALPRRILDNKELEQRVDTSEKWILDRTGIRERRIIDPEQTTSDIACQAAKMALEHAGIGIEDLDLIIVATATPDMLFPATACMVQEKLGAWNAAAFDISAGCTGFVYALTVAEKFLLSPPVPVCFSYRGRGSITPGRL
jgi:3-oxoacyl-[acyl-carrier-protein] synthase-3